MARTTALSECKVNDTAAEALVRRVLIYPRQAPVRRSRRPTTVRSRLCTNCSTVAAKGADMASADGTTRGLLNSVTEFVRDHRRARSDDNGKDSTWFGAGAALKQKPSTKP